MFLTVLEMVVPAVVVLTTLFGLLARGNPRPGGVALFLRVGLVGLALAGLLFYVVEKTALAGTWAAVVANVYRGLGVGGGALVVMAAFGVVLKKRQ